MTRQHFRALAEALASVRPSEQHVQRAQWEIDVLAISAVCEESNPAFDRLRFFDACCKGE